MKKLCIEKCTIYVLIKHGVRSCVWAYRDRAQNYELCMIMVNDLLPAMMFRHVLSL